MRWLSVYWRARDVSPELYHEKKQPYCGELSPTLDTLTKVVFEDAEFSDKAILGICRGCQILNVLFGGSLYQDLIFNISQTMASI